MLLYLESQHAQTCPSNHGPSNHAHDRGCKISWHVHDSHVGDSSMEEAPFQALCPHIVASAVPPSRSIGFDCVNGRIMMCAGPVTIRLKSKLKTTVSWLEMRSSEYIPNRSVDCKQQWRRVYVTTNFYIIVPFMAFMERIIDHRSYTSPLPTNTFPGSFSHVLCIVSLSSIDIYRSKTCLS